MSDLKITVPDMGDFKDVEIIEVLVKEGQTINKNESLITLESDKSSVEVPSTQSGTVNKINVKVGDKVNQGDLILTLKSSEKVEQVKEVSQAELLRLQSLIEPLENKAKRLADDLQGNNAAANLLDNAFNLIEKTKQDIQDLQYVSGRIDTKNLDLTIGKNIEAIKDLLMKVEKLIYTSS